MQTTIPATRAASRKVLHAMIGNLFFGPVEAIQTKATPTHLTFKRVDNGATVKLARAELGESCFIQYFVPEKA